MSDNDYESSYESYSSGDDSVVDLLFADPPDPGSLPAFTRQDTFRIQEKIPNDLEEEFERTHEDEDDIESFLFTRRNHLYDSDSDSEDEESTSPADWSKHDSRVSVPFTGEARPVSVQQPTPMKYFKLLFNEDFITFITNIINTRAAKLAEEKKRQYLPTDNEEVYTVLCLHFLMRCFGAVSVMRYGHFEKFIRMPRFTMLFDILTHTVNPDEEGIYKDAADLRVWYDIAKPVVDKFNELMKELMSPGKELKMDGSDLFQRHDKIYYKQRKEPAQMHFLVDKDNVVQRIYLEDPDEEESGKAVALIMMQDFLNKGHSLYCCPHYTSVTLAEELLKQDTLFTGHMKRNHFKNPAFKKSSTQLIVRIHKERDRKGKIFKTKLVSGYHRNGVCVTKCYRPHDGPLTFVSTEFNGGPAGDNEWYCQVVEGLMSNFSPEPWSSLTRGFQPMRERVNQQVLYTLQAMFVNAHRLYNLSGAPRMKTHDFLENIVCQMLPVDLRQQKRDPNA